MISFGFENHTVRWIHCETTQNANGDERYMIDVDNHPSSENSCKDILVASVYRLHETFPRHEFLEEFQISGYLTENGTLQNYYGEAFNLMIRRSADEKLNPVVGTTWPATFRTSYPSRAGNIRGALSCVYTDAYKSDK